MSRWDEFSPEEREVLKRALHFSGTNLDWSLQEIKSLDEMKSEIDRTLKNDTGDNQ